jgi:hypothetical protein
MTNEVKKRIFWKSDQWTKVAKRSYVIKKDPLFQGSDIEAVRTAQREVLPAEIHRPLLSMQEVSRIKDMWEDLRANGYAQDQGVIQALSHPESKQVHLAIEDIPTDALMKEFFKRMLDTMNPEYIRRLAREEANAVIDRRMPGIVPPDEEPIVEDLKPIERRFKVCVLGLMGAQQERLKQLYGRLIDFHFLSGGEGGNRIKATAALMDLTIKSKWCKGTLGSTSGWPNFTSAGDGGMETIQRLINQRFKLN